MATPDQPPGFTQRLLARAHSPASARRIFAEKIQHKPLLLAPTTKVPSTQPDARARRRQRRQEQTERKRRKPRPLSAREKRILRVYDIPPAERKYTIYEGLHKLWCAYMHEILNVPVLHTPNSENTKLPDETARKKHLDALRKFRAEPASVGPKLASADFHGAKMAIVRSRCVSRVGVQGIVVKDTKFTFDIITKTNEVKTIPKEHTTFRVEVPLINDIDAGIKDLVFELQGSQFENRAPDRATKKTKMHIPADL